MEVWAFIQNKLSASVNVMLLYVLQSEGSSPGRQGFKMAIAADGEFIGTIGGGIMEHKLVEKAKSMLLNAESKVLLQHQYHDKEKAKDQSGMICSGSQLNAFIPLSNSYKKIIERIIAAPKQSIQLSLKGLTIVDETANELQYKTNEDWIYTEAIKQQPVIHIVGGGHVGLALSELMHFLGFYIKLYDDRSQLNTIANNSYADERHIVDYETISTLFEKNENEFLVIASFGYRTDKIILKQLMQKPFFYIGLLGSVNKIEMLMEEFRTEGVSTESLNKIHTPIGLNIYSKTAKEIAVSIAAEIILEKNKDKPTGRTQEG